jgi:SNF2 family DNA or RNA helicase
MMYAAPMVGSRIFQLDGIRFLAGQPDGIVPNARLLADDMGLGKTWQVLLALPADGAAVVVVPASVKYNWLKELKKLRPDLRGEVIEGKNGWRWPADGEVTFLNYDILPERFAPKGGTKKQPAPPVLSDEDVARGKRTTLVVDEAQGVRNPDSLRARRVETLRKLCARTWFLTGTPIENRTKDLWNMMKILGVAETVFGSFNAFMDLVGATKETIYIKGGRGATWTIINWPTDPEAISPRVAEMLRAKVMLRRRKDDVAKDLPPKQYEYVEVALPAAVSRTADKAWDAWVKSNGGKVPNKIPDFDQFSEARAALASARVEAALEIAESYEDAGEPLVVYSAHVEPLDAFGAREGWAVIDGRTPQVKRQEIVDDFQAGRLKGVAVSINAGNAGITLTRASHMLFIDRAWNPKTNRQCEDRIHRIGQDGEFVTYKILTSTHPLDVHVNALLDGKEATIDAAVDGVAAK